jgi:hypothetical protein
MVYTAFIGSHCNSGNDYSIRLHRGHVNGNTSRETVGCHMSHRKSLREFGVALQSDFPELKFSISLLKANHILKNRKITTLVRKFDFRYARAEGDFEEFFLRTTIRGEAPVLPRDTPWWKPSGRSQGWVWIRKIRRVRPDQTPLEDPGTAYSPTGESRSSYRSSDALDVRGTILGPRRTARVSMRNGYYITKVIFRPPPEVCSHP